MFCRIDNLFCLTLCIVWKEYKDEKSINLKKSILKQYYIHCTTFTLFVLISESHFQIDSIIHTSIHCCISITFLLISKLSFQIALIFSLFQNAVLKYYNIHCCTYITSLLITKSSFLVQFYYWFHFCKIATHPNCS